MRIAEENVVTGRRLLRSSSRRTLWRVAVGAIGLAGCTWFAACGGSSSTGGAGTGGDGTDAGDASTTHETMDDSGTIVVTHDAGGTTTDDGGGTPQDSGPAVPTYTISGTITGLAGSGLVLVDDAIDTLPVAAGSAGATVPFTFGTAIESGQRYTVAVKTNPSGPTQSCTVTANNTGVVTANVTDVAITCVTSDYNLGVTVVGLLPLSDAGAADAGDAGDAAPLPLDAGDGGVNAPSNALVLTDSDGDYLSINTDGTYTFPSQVPSGTMFDVEIARQPIYPQASCQIMGNTGTVLGGDVSTIAINCTPASYTLGGTAAASLLGTGLVLDDGLGQKATLNSSGTFAFPIPLESGQSYNVTVTTPPSVPTQTCTVTNPSGTIQFANVSNLGVSCVTNKYNVGYTVTGVAGGGLVLTDTIGTATTPTDTTAAITTNTTADFATEVASNVAYKVAIKTQPTNPSQTCTLNGTAGPVTSTITDSDVNVAVACTTNTFAVSGTVTGLTSGATMKVTNNGADEQTVTGPAAGSASFAFTNPVASGAAYSLAISAQPAGQYCTFVNGSGTIGSAAVTNLAVTCRAKEAVAVLASDANYADVVSSLTGTGAFTSVTGINATANPPTLAVLQMYTAVLVYSDSSFDVSPYDAGNAFKADAGTSVLGTTLATYMTTLLPGSTVPGRVVAMAETNITGYNELAGTYSTTYSALALGGSSTNPDGLNKIDVATTSLLSGVSSFTASVAVRGTGGLSANAVKVAEWGDTNPLVATKTYKIGTGTTVYNHVDLNFLPLSSKVNASYWNGDGAQLMVNALLYR